LIKRKLVQEEVKPKDNLLKQVIDACKPVLTIVFVFAFVVNIFNLITPLYSLLVLDKVLGSNSMETLFYLSLLMVVVYMALHLMQVARSFTLIKLGEWLDQKLSPVLFANSIKLSAKKASLGASQNLRDLQTVKQFLTSTGINTVFDAPWSIVYVIVLFGIHPYMGWLTIIGAVVLCVLAFFNAYATHHNLSEATEFQIKSMNMSDIAARNSEVVEAMGMMGAVVKNWHIFNRKALDYQSIASYRNGIITNFTRFIRMVLQMLVTAIGAYVVVQTKGMEMSVGGMIASSIMCGRALAPFDNMIEIWKSMSGALKSYKKLHFAFSEDSDRHDALSLPVPEGKLSAENLYFAPIKDRMTMMKEQQAGIPPSYTLKGINFDLDAGDSLAIIGPSAAGKSTLAKLIVGVWKPNQGVVRLDGADVYTWGRDDFGRHVGYLPQDVELFSGTVKDNIARLQENANSEDIIKAAKASGAHEMILRLRNGYETEIGVGGASLSGGQRQRVGLARAFYGNPKLIVLDEPNASLDEIGERALVDAMKYAKDNKITTIVVSHRPSILSSVDKILIIQEGVVAAFGSREEILARFAQKPAVKDNK
jgi:PrtD family type I secretion system ABC transporter